MARNKEVVPWWENNDKTSGWKQLWGGIKHLFVGYSPEEEKKVVEDYQQATKDSLLETIIKNWLPLTISAVLLFFVIKD